MNLIIVQSVPIVGCSSTTSLVSSSSKPTVQQSDGVIMVEQSNVNMFTKKFKRTPNEQVYFSHWRVKSNSGCYSTTACSSTTAASAANRTTTITCCGGGSSVTNSSIRKGYKSKSSLLTRKEISKIGSVKFYSYQPMALKQCKKKITSGFLMNRTESKDLNMFKQSDQEIVPWYLPTIDRSLTEESNTEYMSSFVLDTLHQAKQQHVKRSYVLSIKELLN